MDNDVRLAAITELERALSFINLTKAKDAKISKETVMVALESLKSDSVVEDDCK